MKRQLLAATCLLATLIALAGCSPTTNVRGYVPDPRVVDAISPGVDNQTSVQAMLGTPSVPGTFNENRWYYVSKTTEQLAFFDPKIMDQQIVAISFDESGYVSSVDRYSEEDGRRINPVKETTDTRGRELGFWEQIFGNIGRFSGGQAPPPGP